MEDDRVITNHELEEDTFEQNIRPDSLDEYIGQSEVKDNLSVFINVEFPLEPLDIVLTFILEEIHWIYRSSSIIRETFPYTKV